MPPIGSGEVRDVLINAKSIFRGTSIDKLVQQLEGNLPQLLGLEKWNDLTARLISLGGNPNTHDMKAISSALDFMDILNESEVDDRIQLIEMWLDSIDCADSNVHRELAFVLSNQKMLFKDLKADQINVLVQSVRRRSETIPITIRRSFQKFGEAQLVDAAPTLQQPPTHVISPSSATPSSKDIAEATACIEIRGIILKHPKKTTRLLPSDWSRRFRPHLGTFRQFVEGKSPTVFQSSYDQGTGLISVGLSEDSADIMARYRRLLDAHGKLPQTETNFRQPDDQYLGLIAVSDMIERYKICAGKEVYEHAADVLAKFLQESRTGFEISKARKCLSDAGIVPLPLEWFSEILIMPGESVFIRKDSFDRAQSLSNASLEGKICSEIIRNMKLGISYLSCSEICARLGIHQEELNSVLARSGILFHTPDRGYSCESFEELVIGYVSPSTVVKYHKSVELATMSPIRHLVLTIEKVMQVLPDKRLPTEYFVAWCSALDVDAREVLRCLRDKVFFSGPQSDFQIVLASNRGRTSTKNLYANQLPRDIVQSIITEIKKLGSSCTIDKLTSNLHWGKQSELAKKYGQLKHCLENLDDVFYDPRYLYLRTSIDPLVVWPEDKDLDSQSTPDASLTQLENKFNTLCGLASMIVYHLTSGGLNSFPIHQGIEVLANAGYDQDLIYSLEHVFVPDSLIYLRKTGLNEEYPTDASIESAVIRALRNSSRYTVDYDGLIRALLSCSLYTVDEVDSIRHQLAYNCGDIQQIGDGVGRFCFYNPNAIVLKSLAREGLAMSLVEYSPLSPMKIKRKLGYTDQEPFTHETDEVDESDATLIPVEKVHLLPKWCLVGSVVSLEDEPDLYFVIDSVLGGIVRLRAQSNENQEISKMVSQVRPKAIRAGDTVKVIEGPYMGSIFHVVGSTGATVSIQVSKFEFKSLPVEHVVCVKADD